MAELIPNTALYVIILENGERRFTTINETDFTRSDLLDCSIKNSDGNPIHIGKRGGKYNYRRTLISLWETIPFDKIQRYASKYFTPNTNRSHAGEKGIKWIKELNFGFADKNSNDTLKEIIEHIKQNNYTMVMTIKLNETGGYFHLKIQ
jgi:hypothetical protein